MLSGDGATMWHGSSGVMAGQGMGCGGGSAGGAVGYVHTIKITTLKIAAAGPIGCGMKYLVYLVYFIVGVLPARIFKAK